MFSFYHMKSPEFQRSENLLPYDGKVLYYPEYLDRTEAGNLFSILKGQVAWEKESLMMFGKRIVLDRKVAWYGDRPFIYTYSGHSRTALGWTRELDRIRRNLEDFTGDRFNSCLLNFYPTGSDGMGWHRDNERELRPRATIASLSLGAKRRFSFKHLSSKKTVHLELENGSLLLMKNEVQQYWVHQLPKTRKKVTARINLTFRSIIEDNSQVDR